MNYGFQLMVIGHKQHNLNNFKDWWYQHYDALAALSSINLKH